MNISVRLFLGYFLVVGLAAWFVLNIFSHETEPGIRQATEETLVDTAHVLAELAAQDLANNRIGTATNDEIIGPGYLNWDISLAKMIPFGGTRRVTFRAEVYNLLNNVQFSTVNTTANFTAAGVLPANTEFGQYTGARPSRRMQLTLRVDF